jgi:hypothetical protein
MNFIHDDDEFEDLLAIVAAERDLAIGLVEKDYWVTHSLWALQHQGFDIWFKGGTSLSKGFGIVERFSEDLDLKIEPGRMVALPSVSSWKSDGKQATSQRRTYFDVLGSLIRIDGAKVAFDGPFDESCRGANIRVEYPSNHYAELANVLKPFVLLEVGNARVTPSVPRNLSSWIHDYLDGRSALGDLTDNRPKQLRCVHPLVTLIEKLDAIAKRFPRETIEPATFVRHFEDAARIIERTTVLPPLSEYVNARALVDEMLAQKQIAAIPATSCSAFLPSDSPRWEAVRGARHAIGPMFWGERLSLEAACEQIREWVKLELT